MIPIQAKVKQITDQIEIIHNEIVWFTLSIVCHMSYRSEKLIETQTTSGTIEERNQWRSQRSIRNIKKKVWYLKIAQFS